MASPLPGLRRLAQALDMSRAVEHDLDEKDQVEDAEQVARLAHTLELSAADEGPHVAA